MRTTRKIASIVLALCLLFTAIPQRVQAAANDGYMKIVMLDCGRKYFTADWIKAFLTEASDDGYTHVMLGFGNDGLRFLLNDMSLTVNGTTYSSTSVANAIHAGNTAYTTASTGELTESEMDSILATANSLGIEIIPMLNNPGHMDAILSAATSLTGTNCSYNNSARTIDVTNTTAVAFTKALVQKYINYFAAKGCHYFNNGADEYANDRYSSGSMGFGNLISNNKYGYFIKYVNELAAMVKNAGMTPICFNDGIEFNNNLSATVGSTTYTFDKDIVICYWSTGWSGYTPRTPANLISDGFRLINTTGDFYYILGVNDPWATTYTKASSWSNAKVCGNNVTASSVIGGMFCMWCDYPGAESQTQVANRSRMPLRAMAAAMSGTYSSNLDSSVVPGGFNADGTINQDSRHHFELTASVPADCTNTGSNTYTCTDDGCNETYTTTEPALGHDYVAADQDGDTVYTCSRCGDTYSVLLPREEITIREGETSSVYVLDGNGVISVAGSSAVASANLSVVPGNPVDVHYAATASASVSPYSTYSASKLIDGDYSSKYWSDRNQAAGQYVRVDLGAEVRFDAIQVSSPANDDVPTNAKVQVSSDGSTWTDIGTYSGKSTQVVTSTYTVPETVESFRYIRVLLTASKNYWWQMNEIAWGSYSNGTFTRAASTGTVSMGTGSVTSLSFTGTGEGQTYYVIDGVRYVITVEAGHTHHYTMEETVAATCETDGLRTYTCSECEHSYTETVPALGHDYVSVVTAPTCTVGGYTTHTCSRCDVVYQDGEVPPAGHNYESVRNGEYIINTCTGCGRTYTEDCYSTIRVQLSMGETYTFHSENPVSAQIDPSIAVISNEHLNDIVYGDITELTSGSYMLLFGDYLLTTTTVSANGVSGLVLLPVSFDAISDSLYWTFTEAAPGAYLIQSADGRYLNLSASGDLTLSDSEQVLSVENLGGTFAISNGLVYAGSENDYMAAGFEAAEYEEPLWTLMGIVDPGYDVTITAMGQGVVTFLHNEYRYVVDVHVHSYNEYVYQEPGCRSYGSVMHACDCGDYYVTSLPSLGHDYQCTETATSYVYTCSRCQDSYTEAKPASTTYDNVTSISNGNTYVITFKSGNKYYALVHNNTTLQVREITVAGGQITSEVSNDMLWSFNGKFYFNNGTRNYYLYKQSSASIASTSQTLKISTTGTNATFTSSNHKLGFGGYYLTYSAGKVALNKTTSTQVYIYQQNN